MPLSSVNAYRLLAGLTLLLIFKIFLRNVSNRETYRKLKFNWPRKFSYFCLLKPWWVKVFEIPQLRIGFSRLISIMNELAGWLLVEAHRAGYYYSSA